MVRRISDVHAAIGSAGSENILIFESASSLLGKMKAALVEETAPRAEYRVQ